MAGPVVFQLIRPPDDMTEWAEQLAAQGPSIFCLSFRVDDYESCRDAFLEEGAEMTAEFTPDFSSVGIGDGPFREASSTPGTDRLPSRDDPCIIWVAGRRLGALIAMATGRLSPPAKAPDPRRAVLGSPEVSRSLRDISPYAGGFSERHRQGRSGPPLCPRG